MHCDCIVHHIEQLTNCIFKKLIKRLDFKEIWMNDELS